MKRKKSPESVRFRGFLHSVCKTALDIRQALQEAMTVCRRFYLSFSELRAHMALLQNAVYTRFSACRTRCAEKRLSLIWMTYSWRSRTYALQIKSRAFAPLRCESAAWFSGFIVLPYLTNPAAGPKAQPREPPAPARDETTRRAKAQA